MKKYPRLLWAGLLFVVAGCAGVPLMPDSTPDRMPSAMADGRPSSLSSESHMAYWIWKDGDAVWHLRVTTQRVRHKFSGILHPLPGTAIVSVDPVDPKRRDEIDLVNGDLVFNFHPHEDVDGVDFRLAGPDAMEWALRIDDDYDPTHINIGQGRHQPAVAHFLLLP